MTFNVFVQKRQKALSAKTDIGCICTTYFRKKYGARLLFMIRRFVEHCMGIGFEEAHSC